MSLNAEDLAKRLAALHEWFTTLAATLTQTTQQLQASGTLPPETLVDEIAKVPKAFDTENTPAFLESIPSFAALLSIIEGRDALDDEKFAVLDEAVTQSFGRTLAVAAARVKLAIGASAPAAPRTAPAAA